MTDYPTAQRLWAPWRMEFIQAPQEPGCFLCRIAAGGPDEDAENHVVGRRGTALLLLNRYPYSGGHLLAAPRRHVATLAELAADEREPPPQFEEKIPQVGDEGAFQVVLVGPCPFGQPEKFENVRVFEQVFRPE